MMFFTKSKLLLLQIRSKELGISHILSNRINTCELNNESSFISDKTVEFYLKHDNE